MHSGSFALGLFTARSQRSAKDKQTERVGVHRYVSRSVCAVSQNGLRSKHNNVKKREKPIL